MKSAKTVAQLPTFLSMAFAETVFVLVVENAALLLKRMAGVSLAMSFSFLFLWNILRSIEG